VQEERDRRSLLDTFWTGGGFVGWKHTCECCPQFRLNYNT
jgi:hypothetical protein